LSLVGDYLSRSAMAEAEHGSKRGDPRVSAQRDAAIEPQVRAALEGGDVPTAVFKAMRAYGSEIFGFLTAVIGDASKARQVYTAFGQRTAALLPRFRWRCALRVFLYFAARTALQQLRELSGTKTTDSALLAILAPPRAAPYRRGSAKNFVVAVRRCLKRADLELLVLRVDRRFTWVEVALTSLGEAASRREIEEEARRYRDRFHHLKSRIAQAAARSHA
jgi:RNA polymerase sigma-70 factor, ECF subfamily